MKRTLLYILIVSLAPFLSACFKDKGNYDYIKLGEPVVSNLDTLYTVFTGDSLIISPKIVLPEGRTDLTCYWKIEIPEEARSDDYEGQELRIVYGLGARKHDGLLIVRDNATAMQYYYKFTINGKTAFTTGTLALTDDGGQAKLSFIKPDGTVQADIYPSINGEHLGTNPLQIIPLRNTSYMNVNFAYWIVCGNATNPAVEINSDDLKRMKYLKENFYNPPGELTPNYFQRLTNGTTSAVMNEKLYIGTTETAPFGTYYGFFSSPIPGSYNLAPDLVYAYTNGGAYYLGFDKVKKCFLRFDPTTFFGTDYIQEDSLFNPKNLKMDLLEMEKITENDVYAFCDSSGQTYELKFGLNFLDGNSRFKTNYKRKFKGDSLLTAQTRWQSSPVGTFYFTSNDKIYRYNPVNQELRQLDANFGGNQVTMIKILEDGSKLIAGTQNSIYTLDISTGKYGNILSQVNGLPGKVVDIFIRQ
ncbi:PKD-like family lipoprotein [Chitinophaga filiformis]|uniref:PKD-like family protein n=1 Tax=Chitinophaga filiformis TaxID=104663 RepID=A0A1G7UBI4_CHIFI|nr:PKD-like family lipoprotein [Chitinophaga filiformis]SDG44804.1 PKD-like family protein [Chitinophaga filiformis]